MSRSWIAWLVLALTVGGSPVPSTATPAASPSIAAPDLSNAQIERTRARRALLRGDLAAAREHLLRATRDDPDNAYAHLLHAFVCTLDAACAGEAAGALERARRDRHRAVLFRERVDPDLRRRLRRLHRWIGADDARRRAARATFDGYRFVLRPQHGDYTTAKNLLEQAIELAPGYGDAHYWLGHVHLRRGDRDASAAAFERARGVAREGGLEPSIDAAHLFTLASEPPRFLTETAAGLANRVEGGLFSVLDAGSEFIEPRNEPAWEARLGLVAGGDSNPAFLPELGVLVAPGGRVVAADDVSDGVAELEARVEHHPFYDRRGWSLGLAVQGSRSFHRDTEGLDATRARGLVQLAWGEDPLGYLVGPLGYTRVPVGDRRVGVLLQGAYQATLFDGETREETAELGLGLTVREGSAWATQLDLAVADRDVAADGVGSRERSGESWRVKLSQYRYLGRRDRYLRFGVELGELDAGRVFAHEHRELSLELALPLASRWAFQGAASWREIELDARESHPFFPSFLADRPRGDDVLRVAAALIYRLEGGLRIFVRADHVERQVDLGLATGILDLDAERSRASLGLVWLF